MNEPICPYCDRAARLVDSAQFYYGRSYGNVWACLPCQAWVGVHKGTIIPLGRLADKELRVQKIRAHTAFDRLWKAKMVRDGCSKKDARGAGYKWLARQMGIPARDTHIGMFSADQCRQVVALCMAFVRQPPSGGSECPTTSSGQS